MAGKHGDSSIVSIQNFWGKVFKFELNYQPCKKRADSSKTPESKHVEESKSELTAVICQEESKKLQWGR